MPVAQASPVQTTPSAQAKPATSTAAGTPGSAADWYPDPHAPASGRLRYWDGQKWTDNYHTPTQSAMTVQAAAAAATAAQAAVPEPPKKSKKRTWGWVGGIAAGVAVIGIGITAIGLVRMSNQLPECDTFMTAPELNVPVERLLHAEVVCTDSVNGYDYTAPVRDLEDRAVLFTFDAMVSQEQPPSHLEIPEALKYKWGIEVYGDAALSIQIPIAIVDNPDGGWLVDSLERSHYMIYYPEGDPRHEEFENGVENVQLRDNAIYMEGNEFPLAGQWGLRDTYYLVRYIDVDGTPLERPVVSEFGFTHKLSTPEVSYGVDQDSPGTLKLAWRPIPDAKAYVILKAYNTYENGIVLGSRNFEILGFTQETSWSADEALMANLNEGWQEFYLTRQNGSLELYQFSDDSPLNDPDSARQEDDFEYGVIALSSDSSGNWYASAMATTDARAIAGHHVHEIAGNTFVDQYGGNTYFGVQFDDIMDVPTTVPIVSLDGKLRDHNAVLVAGTVLDASGELGPNWYQVGLFAAGTRLGVRVLLHAPEGESILTLIDEFNEYSASQAPQTGAMYSTMGLFELDDATILSTAPDVNYPVFGSHAFVQFLAKHMIARTEAIDLSHWRDQPGRPDLTDAIWEAIDQNPYAYVVDYSRSGDILYLKYSYGPGTYEQHQAELYQAVQTAVASVVKPSMSERQKVTAINNYLVRQAEYDHYAITVTDNWSYDRTGQNWREYALDHGVIHAWEANGAWYPGTFVCYGYAMAFTAMAREAGLDAVTVVGPMTTIGGGHAWNKVYVDGAYYGVDVTWNDSPGGNQLLLVRDSQWGSSSYFGPNAARAEDDEWMLDIHIPLYATP